jgi:hypothetical protein
VAGKTIKDMSDEELEASIAQLEGVVRSAAAQPAPQAPVASPMAAAPVAAPAPVAAGPTLEPDRFESKMAPVGELEFQAQRAANVGLGAVKRAGHIGADILGIPGRLAGEAANVISPPVVAQPGAAMAGRGVEAPVSPRWDAAGAGLGELAQLGLLMTPAAPIAAGVMGLQSVDAARQAETSEDVGGALVDAGMAGVIGKHGVARIKPPAPGEIIRPGQLPVERGSAGLQSFRGAGEEILSTGRRPTMRGYRPPVPVPEAPVRERRQTFREQQEAEQLRGRAEDVGRDRELARNRQALEAPEAPYRETERAAADADVNAKRVQRDIKPAMERRALEKERQRMEGASRSMDEARAARELERERRRMEQASRSLEVARVKAEAKAEAAAELKAELEADAERARLETPIEGEFEPEIKDAEFEVQRALPAPAERKRLPGADRPLLPPATGEPPPVPLPPARYQGRNIAGRAERWQERQAADARAAADAERQQQLRRGYTGTQELERRVPASLRDQTPQPRQWPPLRRDWSGVPESEIPRGAQSPWPPRRAPVPEPEPPPAEPEAPRPFQNAPAGPGPDPQKAKWRRQGFEAAERGLKSGEQIEFPVDAPPEFLEGFEEALDRFDKETRPKPKQKARRPATGPSRR